MHREDHMLSKGEMIRCDILGYNNWILFRMRYAYFGNGAPNVKERIRK